MKALVVGANGFTGSSLTKLLVSRGHQVKAVVRKTSNLDAIKDLNIEYYYADLADHPSFDDAMQDIDVVFNIGAAFRVEGVSQKYFWDVNLEGTRKLLEAAKKKGVKRFIHCSTIGVQGDIKKIPAKENDPYNPGDHYQKSKLDGEKLALQYAKDGLPLTVIRPTSIYGPGDTRYLKLYRFINNDKFRMIGNGKVFHHLVYVDDLAEGMLLAAENDQAVGEIFTIGGEQYITVNDYVKKIAEALNKPVPSKLSLPVFPIWFAGLIFEIIYRPLGIDPPIYRRRVGFFRNNRAFDITKAKKILGYKPKVNVDEGIRRTAKWYKDMGLLMTIIHYLSINLGISY